MAAREMARKFLSKEISYKSAWNFVGVISLKAFWRIRRLWRTPSPYYFLVETAVPFSLLFSFDQEPCQFLQRLGPLAEAIQFYECGAYQLIRLARGFLDSE